MSIFLLYWEILGPSVHRHCTNATLQMNEWPQLIHFSLPMYVSLPSGSGCGQNTMRSTLQTSVETWVTHVPCALSLCCLISDLQPPVYVGLHPVSSDYKEGTQLLYSVSFASALGPGTIFKVFLCKVSHWIYTGIIGSWEERNIFSLRHVYLGQREWQVSEGEPTCRR